MVFQDPYGSLDPHLRPPRDRRRAITAAGGSPQQPRRRGSPSCIERVGLPQHRARRKPAEFSGGQRQRIGIARALASRPGPAGLRRGDSALDVSVQAQVLELLAEIQAATGLTYVFISHNLGVVRAISETVVVMRTAEIVESGSTADVLARPAEPYTQALRRSALDPAAMTGIKPRPRGVRQAVPRPRPRPPQEPPTDRPRRSAVPGPGHHDLRRHGRRRRRRARWSKPRSTPASPPRHRQRLCRRRIERRSWPRLLRGRARRVTIATKAGIRTRDAGRQPLLSAAGSAGRLEAACVAWAPTTSTCSTCTNPTVRPRCDETLATVARARRRGQGRHVGVSNFAAWQIGEINHARRRSRTPRARSSRSSSTTSSPAASRTSTSSSPPTTGLRHHGLQPARRWTAHRSALLRRRSRRGPLRRLAAGGDVHGEILERRAVRGHRRLSARSPTRPASPLTELSLRWLAQQADASEPSCSAAPRSASCRPTSLPSPPARLPDRRRRRLRRSRRRPAGAMPAYNR